MARTVRVVAAFDAFVAAAYLTKIAIGNVAAFPRFTHIVAAQVTGIAVRLGAAIARNALTIAAYLTRAAVAAGLTRSRTARYDGQSRHRRPSARPKQTECDVVVRGFRRGIGLEA